MRIRSLRELMAAAVVAALVTPALAQNNEPTAESGARPNAVRGAVGEAGTVRPATGAVQQGTLQPGTVQPGQPGQLPPAGGTIVEDEALPGQSRTANFPPSQDDQQSGRSGREGQAGRQGQGQGQLSNAALVRWLVADNEAEIRVSEVAAQKSQNDEVKQFAQRMIKDHTQMVQQLQQAGGQNAGDAHGATHGAAHGTEGRNAEGRNATERTDGATRTNRREAGDAAREGRGTEGGRNRGAEGDRNRNAADDSSVQFQGETRALQGESGAETRGADGRGGMNRQGQGGNNPGVALHVQIKEQVTQATIKDLQKKQGVEFDQCYIDQQVVAHVVQLETVKAAEQHAQGALKQTLQQSRQHVEQHLEQARQISHQLHQQGGQNR